MLVNTKLILDNVNSLMSVLLIYTINDIRFYAKRLGENVLYKTKEKILRTSGDHIHRPCLL